MNTLKALGAVVGLAVLLLIVTCLSVLSAPWVKEQKLGEIGEYWGGVTGVPVRVKQNETRTLGNY